MATASRTSTESAVKKCALALRRVAEYKLDSSLNQRMRDLGERRESLSPAEHEELLAFVRFSQQRTIEKLDALAALQELRQVMPELFAET